MTESLTSKERLHPLNTALSKIRERARGAYDGTWMMHSEACALIREIEDLRRDRSALLARLEAYETPEQAREGLSYCATDEPSAWQPIETAPQGDAIVWLPDKGAVMARLCGDLWYDLTTGWLCEPTLWAPMPAGPSETKETGYTWTPDAQGAVNGPPRERDCASDETSASTCARMPDKIEEKSCMYGGKKHCPYFKKGHPCCDCGATVSENASE